MPSALLQATFIGAHHRGIVVYCAAKPTLVYRWQDISNITYESKFVQLHLLGQPTFASLAAATAPNVSHASTLETTANGNGNGELANDSGSGSVMLFSTHLVIFELL